MITEMQLYICYWSIFLLIIIVSIAIGKLIIKTDNYNYLKTKNKELIEDYDDLKIEYLNLHNNYVELNEKSNKLILKNKSLELDYNELYEKKTNN